MDTTEFLNLVKINVMHSKFKFYGWNVIIELEFKFYDRNVIIELEFEFYDQNVNIDLEFSNFKISATAFRKN